MSHKSVFTWTFLLCKHILKLPIIPIMLFLIPVFTLIVQALPEESTDSGVTIGVYFESDDELSCGMKDRLLSNDTAFNFINYEAQDTLVNDVILGRLECGYVFSSEFSNKLQKGKYDNAIMVIQSPSTIFHSAANEIVFSCLIQLCGYDILGRYVDIDEIPVSRRKEAQDALFASYDNYCSSSETFHLDIITVGGISINDTGASSLGITFPLRGLLSVLIFLAGMTGCVAWLKDKEQGLFAPRPRSFYTLSRILYPLLPTVLFLLCSETALFISGRAYSPSAELLLALRYIVLITFFANLCSIIFKRSSLVISLIPVLILGSLIFCPVFVNVESFIPVLRFISRLFLPRYFL